MEAIRLEAKPRTPGKGSARAARRNKEVPCILYGHNLEPVPFQVPELDLRPLIYTAEFHRVEVVMGDNMWECFLKKMDYHPVTDRPFHGDFQAFVAGEKITLMLPIKYQGTPLGQKEGGRTEVLMHEIEVTLLPKDIPDHITVDISGLQIGDSLHVSDLPSGEFEYNVEGDNPIVSVQAPRAEIDEEADTTETVVGLVGDDDDESEEDED